MSRIAAPLALLLSSAALIVAGWSALRAPGRSDGIIEARGLVIRDDAGRARLVLGAPVPDPRVRGVVGARAAPASGLVLIGPDGNERGGYLVVDDGGEAVLTLDSADGSREVFKVVANPQDGASLFVQHQGGAEAMITTYRGEPELHLVGPDGTSRFSRPEGVPLPR